ncbi:hypothetical protein J7I98_36410 [Streptomyces sp. ISL-98]|uniref:hypothetical protein n=1 Tax=Streptomyces sp. ISL-98 TaxID=2819192 RepID=UPI001BECCEEC|nr:hypothetical protein [Streptomyces sp. ISL-98]MBT2511206.1 hypothetical protein [Streptomyces sp. ISL-98]
MTADAFFSAEPSVRSSWRLAILMGANSRTYKFALGDALLEHARHGHTEILLSELAVPYAMSLVEHTAKAPQAPEGTSIGKADFLAIAAAEREETQKLGRPTDLLLEAAVKSMPAMVMQRFHNLRGGTEVPHRFYEVAGNPRQRIVRLTPELLQVAQSEQATGLRTELGARWTIVESSFAAGIGRALIEEGVTVDWSTLAPVSIRASAGWSTGAAARHAGAGTAQATETGAIGECTGRGRSTVGGDLRGGGIRDLPGGRSGAGVGLAARRP